MRQLFTTILLTISASVVAQEKGRLSVAVMLQPEAMYYKNDYNYYYGELYYKWELNMGIAASVRYDVNNKLFLSAGAGFVSRRYETNFGVSWTDRIKQLPVYYDYPFAIRMTGNAVSYRTLTIPVSAGYYFLNKNKFKSFALAELSANYLLNANYDLDVDSLDGHYNRSYWQGYSLNMGAGCEYKIFDKFYLTSSLTYPVINKVTGDDWLYGDRDNLAITYRYLRLGIGITVSL